MNFLKYNFGGVPGQFLSVCRSSIARSSGVITSAAQAAAIYAVCAPQNAHATMPSGALQHCSHPLVTLQAGTVCGANRSASLQIQAIPEPQTWIVAGSGLGTLVALQRFRRRRG